MRRGKVLRTQWPKRRFLSMLQQESKGWHVNIQIPSTANKLQGLLLLRHWWKASVLGSREAQVLFCFFAVGFQPAHSAYAFSLGFSFCCNVRIKIENISTNFGVLHSALLDEERTLARANVASKEELPQTPSKAIKVTQCPLCDFKKAATLGCRSSRPRLMGPSPLLIQPSESKTPGTRPPPTFYRRVQ